MHRLKTTRSLILVTALAVLGFGLLAGAVLNDAFDGDEERTIMATPSGAGSSSQTSATAAPDIVVDDGIDTADARRAARAAENGFDGVALSVDHDDRRYEVELQRADGTIAEVLVDDRFRALGIDPDS